MSPKRKQQLENNKKKIALGKFVINGFLKQGGWITGATKISRLVICLCIKYGPWIFWK